MLLLVHILLVLGSRAGIRDCAHLLPSSIHHLPTSATFMFNEYVFLPSGRVAL